MLYNGLMFYVYYFHDLTWMELSKVALLLIENSEWYRSYSYQVLQGSYIAPYIRYKRPRSATYN
jgi:hypothetical protein